jgi:chromosome segregation ATPase
MPQPSSGSPRPPAAGTDPGPLPRVRLELRHAAARPTSHEVADTGFVIGSVPGCDLRLPGNGLPPVICLITRQPGTVLLRKLAPVQNVLVNGRPLSGAPLADGDRLLVGAVELRVTIELPPVADTPPADLAETWQQLAARQRQLEEQSQELEADRVLWYRRRDEIEQECRRQQDSASLVLVKMQQVQQDLAVARQELDQREQAVRQRGAELGQLQEELKDRAAELIRQEEELSATREELDTVRRALADRLRQRRDRLARLQDAVRRAARKVQKRKRELDEQVAQSAEERQEGEARQAELLALAEELDRQRQRLEEQQRVLAGRERELQQQGAEKSRELQERERRLAEERRALEKGQSQHQGDLVQLVRLETLLDEKEKRLRGHALEVDHRFEQLQRASRELEEHAGGLDEWHTRLADEQAQLDRRKAEQDTLHRQVLERAAALEGQQAMLATLRTRLERLREEVRRDEQQLAEQRDRQELIEAELQDRVREAQTLRAELDNDQALLEQEKRRFAERETLLEEAVAQLRQAQETLAREQEQVRQREEAVGVAGRDQAEQAALLRARQEQVNELQERLTADRQALTERETRLGQAEQAVAGLQEQLRRRGEELAARQKAQAEQERQQGEVAAALATRRDDLERSRQEQEAEAVRLQQELAQRREELDAQAAELEARARELDERAATLHKHVERLKEAGRNLGTGRESLAEERARWTAEQQAREQALTTQRDEVNALREETAELHRQLPDLEMRARAAVERLVQVREQVREQLAEVHGYAGQSRDDLEALQRQLQAEAERMRQQEAALHRARDEHRLAVAAFRQQLIDWQGQLAEVRRALAHDESRLERRQAEVEEQALRVDATTARLAQQAEELHQQQRLVAEHRGEVHRHLDDMREWYRRKLRELAGLEQPEDRGARSEDRGPGDANGYSIFDPQSSLLDSEVEPGDRQLGELLRSLELVEADTLAALLAEAKRQRRSLRQLLLSGGYLTLYQMALIEAGNVAGLVLGPVRVVDRLRATPREVVYRVFDPRSGQEALLRHLAEAESDDAVHPDEFRQRFAAAAAVRHPNLAATHEVLDIGGRPAVLQEWVRGLPSTDWTALAAVPGVWLRLVQQAAEGLHAVHSAGLVHGRLQPGLVVLAADGTLKMCGLGEPAWLTAAGEAEPGEVDAAGDLAALGRLAGGWAALAAERKTARGKALPEPLQAMLRRLTAEQAEERYADSGALVEDLKRLAEEVPAGDAAWQRLLRQVREEGGDVEMRLSA